MEVLKKGIGFTVFSVLNSGLNFILLLLLAKFLTPHDYGILNLFTTVILLLNVFISFNSSGFFSVEYFNVSFRERRIIMGSIIILSVISFFVLLFVLYIVSLCLPITLGITFYHLLMAAIICLMQIFFFLFLEILRLDENVILYGVYSLINVLLNFCLSVLFVVYFNSGWEGRLYANLFAGLFLFVFSLIFFYKKNYFRYFFIVDIDRIKGILRFGIPLIPHDTSLWLRQGLDRYLIAFFYTPTEVGLYSFAFNFANIIHIVGSAFNKINSVYLFKNLSILNIDSFRRIKRNNSYVIAILLVLSIVIVGFVFILIPFVFKKYIDSLIFIIPLSIGALFQAIYYLYVNYLFYYKKTLILMAITTLSALLHVVLSFVLTPLSIMNTAFVTLFINLMVLLSVYKKGMATIDFVTK